jgi:hypothetical protein
MFTSGARKKQKCLHLTTVSDAELLGSADTASILPTIHPCIPFSQKLMEEARIMQLDLVIEAFKGSDAKKGLDNTMDDSLVVQDADIDIESLKKLQQEDEKKIVFETMQKSYTELALLLDLTTSLNNDQYMTLVTTTRETMKPIGVELPTMQRLSILKYRYTTLSEQLKNTCCVMDNIIKQRRTFLNNLLILNKEWKLEAVVSSVAKRALHCKSQIGIDCTPKWLNKHTNNNNKNKNKINDNKYNSKVISYFESCLVPLEMDQSGNAYLTIEENQRKFSSLELSLVSSTNGKMFTTVSSWNMTLPHLLELRSNKALETIHKHCQRRQAEMLDIALMLCFRQDATSSVNENRWIIAPPIVKLKKDSKTHIDNNDIMTFHDLLNEGNYSPTMEIQSVSRSQVVIRLSTNILLCIKMLHEPSSSSVNEKNDQKKNTNENNDNNNEKEIDTMQLKLHNVLESALLRSHISLFTATSTEDDDDDDDEDNNNDNNRDDFELKKGIEAKTSSATKEKENDNEQVEEKENNLLLLSNLVRNIKKSLVKLKQ